MSLQTKILEIRDSMTMISALAINMQRSQFAPETREYRHLWRSGYDWEHPTIMLTYLDGSGSAFTDPYQWSRTRTMHEAHKYITENWDKLKSGDVVCVETILGERTEPKKSEFE